MKGALEVRVGVVDDSGLFRRGLGALLEAAGLEVCFSVGNSSEALDQADRVAVDAIITDLRMPPDFVDEGLVLASALKERHPDVGVLLLSTFAELSIAARLLLDRGGVGVGYLLKDHVGDVDQVVRALRTVVDGGTAVDPDLVSNLFRKKASLDGLEELSERERDVLRQMAEGRSNAGIADELGLSRRTVETYVARLLAKLGVPETDRDNRRVLAVLAWLNRSRQQAKGTS